MIINTQVVVVVPAGLGISQFRLRLNSVGDRNTPLHFLPFVQDISSFEEKAESNMMAVILN